MNNNYFNQYGNPYQQMYRQPNQQVMYMAYANGLDGARNYNMGLNQVVYLKDTNDESILYEKKTDAYGNYYIKAFKLNEMQANNGAFHDERADFAKEIQNINAKLDEIYKIITPKETTNNEQQ